MRFSVLVIRCLHRKKRHCKNQDDQVGTQLEIMSGMNLIISILNIGSKTFSGSKTQGNDR